MPDNSVDSIVTDPPYGLSFMGKKWDYDVPSVAIWAECLRVLKPGGHLLSFAGTRTQHRMAVNIEDAGFEIRDMIAWVYGSGFPKSHNLKDDWEGWGTTLKPALEPITVARKPFKGTVVANVLEYGTGAINIDGCRVPFAGEQDERESKQKNKHGDFGSGPMSNKVFGEYKKDRDNYDPTGRWPANLIHDGSAAVTDQFPISMDKGAEVRASRFFYGAKASRKDRNEGLPDPGPQFQRGTTLRKVENTDTKGNNHPTVKPTDLMAYLCRLVTPPGGIVLDPFMGSGSTGKAAMREGFRFMGIEMDPDYFEIAKARIKHEANKNTR
jgi:site-specific DNA-methyltransferase (adenine-specific)